MALILLQELDVQSQALELPHQDVEGFRQTRLEIVFALEDLLVHAGTAGYVVGFHGQKFLEGVRRPIGLQGPDLHLTQTLAAELGLAAQGLLRHQRVRSDGTGMDFIGHQVMQLHHVHHPYRHIPVELLAGAAVPQPGLAAGRAARPW